MNSKELDRLEKQLPNVSRQSRLFKIVQSAVKKWGHWKVKPRGKPRIGYWKKRGE